MPRYILYGTSGCHLCEQATELLEMLLPAANAALVQVDISESDELVSRYGIRIPVLKSMTDGSELGWPFDARTASVWLGMH